MWLSAVELSCTLLRCAVILSRDLCISKRAEVAVPSWDQDQRLEQPSRVTGTAVCTSVAAQGPPARAALATVSSAGTGSATGLPLGCGRSPAAWVQLRPVVSLVQAEPSLGSGLGSVPLWSGPAVAAGWPEWPRSLVRGSAGSWGQAGDQRRPWSSSSASVRVFPASAQAQGASPAGQSTPWPRPGLSRACTRGAGSWGTAQMGSSLSSEKVGAPCRR